MRSGARAWPALGRAIAPRLGMADKKAGFQIPRRHMGRSQGRMGPSRERDDAHNQERFLTECRFLEG
jgi:hypothetical protein